MHNSIFLKATDFSSNPITEFNKINDFIINTSCYYENTIYKIFFSNFKFSKHLRSRYSNLADCINENTHTMRTLSKSIYSNLDEATQEKIIDEFLLFCEILIHLYEITRYDSHNNKSYYFYHLDLDVVDQTYEMIEKSLQSIGYKIVRLKNDNRPFEIIPLNTEAEVVAALSPTTIKECIIRYLGVRKNNSADKEIVLNQFIDLLEPTLKKYSSVELVGKTKEFSQMLRHPEINKDMKQYSWFYKSKNQYYDDIFQLCIFVQHHDIARQTINEFNNLKKISD